MWWLPWLQAHTCSQHYGSVWSVRGEWVITGLRDMQENSYARSVKELPHTGQSENKRESFYQQFPILPIIIPVWTVLTSKRKKENYQKVIDIFVQYNWSQVTFVSSHFQGCLTAEWIRGWPLGQSTWFVFWILDKKIDKIAFKCFI